MAVAMAGAVGALLMAAGCGGPSKTLERPQNHSARQSPRATSSPYGYAASPLTAFADEITSLAFATLQRKPLPKVSFPLWQGAGTKGSRGREGDRTITTTETVVAEGNLLVKHTTVTVNDGEPQKTRKVIGRVDRGVMEGTPLVWPVRAVAFVVEVDVMLNPRRRHSGPGYTELTLKEAILVLDRTGLKLASLELEEDGEKRMSLPPSLKGLGAFFGPVITALRAGQAPPSLATPRYLTTLGAWTQNRCKLPDLARLATYQQRIKGFRGQLPEAYEIEHINILVVDAKGTKAYLSLSTRGSSSSFGLRRLPLVTVGSTPDF